MAEKKYYFLKLENTFFDDPRIKKMRKIAGGDTYTCIYLKLMLYTLQFAGILEYEGIEDSLESEIALKIDEDETNVKILLSYLIKNGLLEDSVEYMNEFELIDVRKRILSETDAAVRKRKSREKLKKQLSVTSSQGGHGVVTNSHTERELEVDREQDLNREQEAPSLREIADWIVAKKYNVIPEKFYDYYAARNWRDKHNNKVSDWKLKVTVWHEYEKNKVSDMQAEECQENVWKEEKEGRQNDYAQ